MNADIRRAENNLTTLGTGVIVLALWSMFKFALQYLVMNAPEETLLPSVQNEYTWASIVVWIFIIFNMLLQCYVGFSARSEGKGKHKSSLYLVAAVCILLFFIMILFLECFIIFAAPLLIINMTVGIIIDGTTLIFVLEVLINSIKIRRLRKCTAEEETT